MATTEKDIKRILDIQAQPGKEMTLAGKMAKLIKDSSKAHRRYEASESIFGGSHVVTNIFWSRYQELIGGREILSQNIIPQEVKDEVKAPLKNKIVKPEPEVVISRIGRSQKDFPIGISVKLNGVIGTVTYHTGMEEIISVQFEDGEQDVNIYDLKRA